MLKFLYSQKKNIVLLATFILMLIIIGIISFLLLSSRNTNTKYEELADTLVNEQQKYQEYIPKDRLNKSISILENNSLSDQERYDDGIVVSVYYMQDAYYKTNDPEIRIFLDSINEDVKKLFPNQHNELDILVACADSECGESADPALTKLIQEINSLTVDKIYINTITTNLNVGIHLPYTTEYYKGEKLLSYLIVYTQLLDLNDAEASSSAKSLNEYVQDKYNKDLTDDDILLDL